MSSLLLFLTEFKLKDRLLVLLELCLDSGLLHLFFCAEHGCRAAPSPMASTLYKLPEHFTAQGFKLSPACLRLFKMGVHQISYPTLN